MATTSFDKNFVVTDEVAIAKFKNAAKNPRKVSVKKRDYESDKEKGIQRLVRKLSNSATC
ncbi:hypothetical protein MW374_004106 [Vibrio parahaemolyticus]|jgi:hypothetical protein|uniref:Uncharacterized protein n=2 Tax=Vibrio TaxID=662 RepID=A0A9Q3UHY0_VIBPH|nr:MULTISPECIES: hypothetical protein [Vibrio]ETZ10880.1 hypothetical protein AJ90_19195 [Vibrio parahaemolyticus M0605]EGQ8100786.1 hypothetical protein [Vibrio parahaemolyticus]EGQ8549324.1 hypothetical protein [Vibrio parahaemolyticus]EGQ8923909.1 hypothetical protein [Vibrio parahaemolyticus]EGQ9074153.1 hypothetical protein [Vibrio parahaemolyticus]